MTRADQRLRARFGTGPAAVLAALACLAVVAAGACARIDVNDGLEVSSGYDAGLIPESSGDSVSLIDPAAPVDAQLEFDPGDPEVIDSPLDELRTEAGGALEQAGTALVEGETAGVPIFTPAPLPDETGSAAESAVSRPDELIIAVGSYHADIPPNSALNIRDEAGGETLAQLPWGMIVKTTGAGKRLDDTTWAEIKPVGTAEWDVGWVIFDLLAFGRPAATPTPDEVVEVEPTPTPEPTQTPEPTPTPEDDNADGEDDNGGDGDSDQNDPEATPTLTPTPEPTPDSFDAPVTDVFLVQFDLVDPEGAHIRSAPGAGELVGKLPAGTQITIVGGTGFRINGAAWVQVSGGDLQGWIAVSELQVI